MENIFIEAFEAVTQDWEIVYIARKEVAERDWFKIVARHKSGVSANANVRLRLGAKQKWSDKVSQVLADFELELGYAKVREADGTPPTTWA